MPDDLEMRIINDLVKLGPDDVPKSKRIKPPQEQISARDLKPEAYPIKRETKRRPRRNVPRGSGFTNNFPRAVYQEPEKLQAQHDRTPKPQWTPGQGETNLWNGIDNRGHTGSNRVI
jgi:hypothetical protein